MARFSVYSGSVDRDLSYHGVPRPAITSRASVESIDRGCGLSVRAESVIVQTAIFRDRRVGLARSPVRSDSLVVLVVALCQQLLAQAVFPTHHIPRLASCSLRLDSQSRRLLPTYFVSHLLHCVPALRAT